MSRLGAPALAAAVGIIALAAAPAPVAAQFFFGFPRFYAPYPYYAPPPYYPYYPAPAYYPPPPAYYAPPPTVGQAPAAETTPTAASITYTEKPAFRNSAGQTCREFKAPSGALGTACQDTSGQWRVAN